MSGVQDEEPDFVVDRVVSADGSTAVLTLRGSLDIGGVDGFRHAFKALGAQTVEVRLEALDFLDSSGLAAVLYTLRLGAERGQTVRYTGVAGEVREVLERTGTLAMIVS